MIISVNKTTLLIIMIILATVLSILGISYIMDNKYTNDTDCCRCRVDL